MCLTQCKATKEHNKEFSHSNLLVIRKVHNRIGRCGKILNFFCDFSTIFFDKIFRQFFLRFSSKKFQKVPVKKWSRTSPNFLCTFLIIIFRFIFIFLHFKGEIKIYFNINNLRIYVGDFKGNLAFSSGCWNRTKGNYPNKLKIKYYISYFLIISKNTVSLKNEIDLLPGEAGSPIDFSKISKSRDSHQL